MSEAELNRLAHELECVQTHLKDAMEQFQQMLREVDALSALAHSLAHDLGQLKQKVDFRLQDPPTTKTCPQHHRASPCPCGWRAQ